LGSKDPESAAQETLKRSLGNAAARSSIEYFFAEELPPDSTPPDWSLSHLLAWLHGVLNFVVREEHNRAGHRREVLIGQLGSGLDWNPLDPADPAPLHLDVLIRREMQEIVVECLPALDSEYRQVLSLRASGLKYDEIAVRLGVNENTVATWVSRGIRTLAQYVRRRADRKHARNGETR
jgi:RNA polymerase sigma factor (sigma-70 family)